MHQVALIGAGNAGATHRAAWRTVNDAVLATVIDTDPKRAQTQASSWGVTDWTTDYRTVLENPAITICDICVPNALHARIAVDCLRAGKHVLLEKPIATTMPDAMAIVDAQRASGALFMVAENCYFSPVTAKAVEIIRAGTIGELYSIRVQFEYPGVRVGPPEEDTDGDWRSQAALTGGGIVFDGGTHVMSLARMFMGEVDTVWSIEGVPALKDKNGLEITFYSMVKFVSGAGGLFHFVSCAGWDRCHIDLTLHGTLGVIEMDLVTGRMRHTGLVGSSFRHYEYCLKTDGGYDEELAHFMNCVRTGAQPLSSALDQARTLALVLATYESASSGGAATSPRSPTPER